MHRWKRLRWRRDVSKASGLLRDKSNVLVFSGAGLSAASGLPTFDSRESSAIEDWGIELWREDAEWRAEVQALIDQHRDVQPNAGHRAIDALVVTGRAVHVTSNVDGLSDGIELCGNARRTVTDQPTQLQRPDVVFVGEAFHEEPMDEYLDAVEAMDSLLIVGASPLVGLWASAVSEAERFHLPVVVINRRPEPVWSEVADVLIVAPAERALPRLVARMT